MTGIKDKLLERGKRALTVVSERIPLTERQRAAVLPRLRKCDNCSRFQHDLGQERLKESRELAAVAEVMSPAEAATGLIEERDYDLIPESNQELDWRTFGFCKVEGGLVAPTFVCKRWEA